MIERFSFGGPQGRLNRKEQRYGYPGCLDHRRADWNRARGGCWLSRGKVTASSSPVATRQAGQELATELRALGAEAEFLRADVRHEDDVRNLVDRTVARFGRLDAAVNNAGTEGQPGPVTSRPPTRYAATFDTNVLGTLLSMKHELRVMQAQGSGSIVNISSTYGHEGGGRRIGVRGQQACRRRT